MKRKIYFVLLCMASAFTSNAQICNEPLRFSEVPFFANNQIDSVMNQPYGNAVDWQGNSEALTMNVFFPKNAVDTMPSGEWENIRLAISEFYPQFRGRKLNIPNFNFENIEQWSFLIANKQEEDFELLIDWIGLE